MISQTRPKGGSLPALAPGEPALSSRAGRPLCNSHGKLLPQREGGREFPSLTSAQLCHVSRRSRDTAGPQPCLKWVWRPECPRTGGNPLPRGQDCISKGWQELCRWKAWSPHSAATRHVWHSGKSRDTNTHGVITPCRVKPRLGTGTSVTTSLVGEDLSQPCCAGKGVVKEGRTRSSLQFPCNLFSSTGSHSSSHHRPIPEFSHALLYRPGVHIRSCRGWFTEFQDISF